MKKSMVVMLAIGAMVCSAAFASSEQLPLDALDNVSNVTGALDWVGDTSASFYQPAFNLQESLVVAAGAGNSAAADSGKSFSGAVADRDGIAVNGFLNFALDADICVELNNVDNFNLAFGLGSVALMGDHNKVAIDNSFVGGADALLGFGVVAREAEVTNSFNVDTAFTFVDVDIDDSFNVSNNKLQICGQDDATAIVNANAAGNQMVGSNLNVTNATAAVPSLESGFGSVVPFISGNAIALTVTSQLVVNNTITSDRTFQF